ncbi:MAG: DUF4143 domain-containing protein [Bacteroidales bacterium]|nr:DUF4143 domain-containing protein [Bacteroidales bacterium]
MEIKRKIDGFLTDWKARDDHKPLIVKGARQIGKTFSVSKFAKNNYANVVEVNFALQPQYASIFDDGYEVDSILKNLSFLNPSFRFVPGDTLFFFDEIQQQPAVATCLKSFYIDGRYDVICSGSLMGISYNEIESNSVGYKEDFDMKSMDFEEFLRAKGFLDEQIDGLFEKMLRVEQLSKTEMEVMSAAFKDYIVVGGMPAIVKKYLENNTFASVLKMQRQLLRDYDEDITKYAVGLDKAKVRAVYNHIPVFLGQPNKKFQISKIAKGARNREYVGTVDWLDDAGVVNICYCMGELSLPLKGNYIYNNFKVYYHDTGLLIASLDEEAQRDLRENKNFNTYKGAIYENIVAEMLVKQGYSLFFYRNEKSTVEIDFFVRDTDSLIPIEVKAQDGATASLNKVIDDEKYSDIMYGIKFANKNIGFNGRFYTFPYFLAFLLKRFLKCRNTIS